VLAGWGVGIAATLIGVWLHLVCLTHAGALWRDEAGVVGIATLPAFGETLSRLGHDPSPLIFPTAIRVWSAIGFGNTELGLRAYGLLVGVLILGAAWFNGRMLTRSVPLISLGLLAANVTVVRWGDSLRAYGTGSFLMLVTLALMWRFVRAPSRGRWLMAGLAALFSVQSSFPNAFLLLAVCVAGCAVCWRRRDGRGASAVLAIGVLAAASLLPYLRIVREVEDWSVLSQTGFRPALVWQNLSAALAPAAPWTKWLWIGLAVAAACRWITTLRRASSEPEDEKKLVTFYAATALIAGMISFFVFVWHTALPTQVWYYVPLMTFAAVCLDAALANWRPRWRSWRLALPCLMVGLSFPKALELAQCRQTNIDLIAAELRERAKPNDLILVHPWYYGITFDRYYRGAASWTTIPALEDHRFHRYDLLKVKMQMEHPIRPVLDRVAATLQSSNRVWIVGGIPIDGTPPPDLRPAPNNPWGWLDEPYSRIWGAQAGYFIATHATQGAVVMDSSTNCVNPYENLPLVSVAGWRLPPSPTAPQ